MSIGIFPNSRDEQIGLILSELAQLHPRSEAEKYAIEQNALFFKSIRSVFLYSRWLYGARKHIHKKDLLEINELLPDLDEIFHAKMAEVERRPFPGIIRPPVDYVTALTIHAPQGKRLRIASLGSGSMEVERQIIEQVQQKGELRPLTVVGFDISSKTRAFAGKNLSALANVRIVQETKLTEEKLAALERETQELILVVISDNDIFALSSDFAPRAFDLVMTILFLHHLHEEDRIRLVRQMRILAPRTLNYDGYQDEIVIPILSMTGWHNPVFLNAAVFSSIRFPSRIEAQNLHVDAQVHFYNHGHYSAAFPS